MIVHQVVEDKCWGKVAHLFNADHCAVSYLEVNAYFRSSRHRHDWRANQFSVVTGRIAVEEFDEASLTLKKSTVVDPGQSYTVPSGVVHRFRVLKSGVVIEVYWPDVPGGAALLDDITRFDVGGNDDS